MPERDDNPWRDVLSAAKLLQHLDPGSLAELRRMGKGASSPVFWRLVSRHPQTIGRRDQEEIWRCIIQILAILTPKGDPESRPELHNNSRRFGAVLCDGGDPDWPDLKTGSDPKPVFSEYRLMKLVMARGPQRAVLLTRAARAIATSMKPGSGVNVTDVLTVLLDPNDERRLAEPYYRRLDRAGFTKSTQHGESNE